MPKINKNTPEYWDQKLPKVYTNKAAIKKRIAVYQAFIPALKETGLFSLLDVGCGAGLGISMLLQHFPKSDFYGLDFSPQGIRFAQAHYHKINFILADIRSYKFAKSFDFISIIRVLEHFEKPFEILDKCLGAVSQAVLLSIPMPGVGCSEHVVELHPYSFNDYIFKDLPTQAGISGYNFLINAKKLSDRTQ